MKDFIATLFELKWHLLRVWIFFFSLAIIWGHEKYGILELLWKTGLISISVMALSIFLSRITESSKN